jgi:glycosyltransferase involved in cell wall biosynthesis
MPNILIMPMFSRTTLNGDSCYNVIRALILEARRLGRDDLFWDFLWPSNGKDWQYYRDGLFDLPNVRRLPMRFHPAKVKQVVTFSPYEIGTYLDYKNPHDLIWNHTVEIGDLIKNQVASFNPDAKPSVVNTHHYVLHRSLPYPVEIDQIHILLRQLVGSHNVDVNIFDSDYCRWMFFDNADRYLHPDMVARIRATTMDIPHGTLSRDEFAPLAADVPRAPIFTFAYNHRLENYKKWHDTFDLLDALHADGLAFRVTVFGVPSDQMNMSVVAKRPYVDVYVSQTRNEYLRRLATCHANTLNTAHETFCLSAVESMALGQVCIAPNGLTFPQITGSDATLFRTPREQADLLRRALTDEAWRFEQGERQRAHVWREFNATSWAESYLALFDRLIGHADILGSLKHPDSFRQIIGARSRWRVDELRQALYGSFDDGRLLASSQSFPAVKIVRLARQLGYRDARSPDDAREPMLVKEA